MNIAVKVDAPETAAAEAYAAPLDELNPGNADRFETGAIWPVASERDRTGSLLRLCDAGLDQLAHQRSR